MTTIVSGGQTGVDRAALDLALELGLERAGWCPRGRAAEDGPIESGYQMRETLSRAPEQRTVWNVFDSDATLIISPGELKGGSLLAFQTARRFGRPLFLARPDAPNEAAEWLSSLGAVPLLNVAGPRESEWPGAYATTERVLRLLLEPLTEQVATPARRALITGGGGYLAHHLVAAAPPGWEIHTTRRTAGEATGARGLELSDALTVREFFAELRPSLVIHTAYGAGDGSRDIVEASRSVAAAAAAIGARLIHISSDMVLDGKRAPFAENAAPAPVHEYGRWKASAEAIVHELCPDAAIVRVSLLTRLSPPDPRTQWVLSGLRGEASCELFADELRTPTLVEDASRQIWEVARLGADGRGVWHLANPEALSRYALGCLIAAAHGHDPARLRSSSIASSSTPRPRDLRLLTQRADLYLPTRSRSLSELVSECRSATRFH